MSAVDLRLVAGPGPVLPTRAEERAARRRRRRPQWEWLALAASPWTGVPYAAFVASLEDDEARLALPGGVREAIADPEALDQFGGCPELT
jgi:hypothetical protein